MHEATLILKSAALALAEKMKRSRLHGTFEYELAEDARLLA